MTIREATLDAMTLQNDVTKVPCLIKPSRRLGTPPRDAARPLEADLRQQHGAGKKAERLGRTLPPARPLANVRKRALKRPRVRPRLSGREASQLWRRAPRAETGCAGTIRDPPGSRAPETRRAGHAKSNGAVAKTTARDGPVCLSPRAAIQGLPTPRDDGPGRSRHPVTCGKTDGSAGDVPGALPIPAGVEVPRCMSHAAPRREPGPAHWHPYIMVRRAGSLGASALPEGPHGGR